MSRLVLEHLTQNKSASLLLLQLLERHSCITILQIVSVAPAFLIFAPAESLFSKPTLIGIQNFSYIIRNSYSKNSSIPAFPMVVFEVTDCIGTCFFEDETAGKNVKKN